MQKAEAFLLFSCDTLVPSEVRFHMLLLFWETEVSYKVLHFENVTFLALVNSFWVDSRRAHPVCSSGAR